MLHALRSQIVEIEKDRDALALQLDADNSQTSKLRSKAKLVTDELLEQQRKAKTLQKDVVQAREDLLSLSRNCSFASNRLAQRFNVTLRELHDRTIKGQQYRVLLNKNVRERSRIESSLGVMQDRVYNLTKALKSTKTQLKDAIRIVKSQRVEIAELKASGGASTVGSKKKTSPVAAAGSASDWTEHKDESSGRVYYYNAKTKKSSWTKPAA